MGNCDVCGGFTTWDEGTAYTADEFRTIVRQGFEPPPSVVMLGREAVQGWKNGLVANSTTGWLLCPGCARQAAPYMPKLSGTGPGGHTLFETMLTETLLGLDSDQSSSSEDESSPTPVLPLPPADPEPARRPSLPPAFPKNIPEILRTENKVCPTCQKEIAAEAITCEYCNARFEVVVKGYCSTEHGVMDCDTQGVCLKCGQGIIDKRIESTLVEAGQLPAPEPIQAVEVEPSVLESIEPPAITDAKPPAATKKCPLCAEEIKAEARLCRFCGAKFSISIKGYCTRDHQLLEADNKGACPICQGELIDTRVVSALIEEKALPPARPVPVQAAVQTQPQSFPVPASKLERPGCVTAYAIMLWIGAVITGISGFGISASMADTTSGSTAIIFLMLGIALTMIGIAIGLWNLKNWARITVIVLLSLAIISNIITGITALAAPQDFGSFGGTQSLGAICGFLIGLSICIWMISWFAQNGKYFKQPPAVHLMVVPGPIPSANHPVQTAPFVTPPPMSQVRSLSSQPSPRWYFLAVGWAMAQEVFNAISTDQEFTLGPRGSASPEDKKLVRYYTGRDSSGYQGKAKARELGLTFGGFTFPLDISGEPEKVVDIGSAYQKMSGMAPSDAHENPLFVILADKCFDLLLRGFQQYLNLRYMQMGALPITNLMYTDDFNSAKNLLLAFYEIREKSNRHESRFKDWCAQNSIAPEILETDIYSQPEPAAQPETMPAPGVKPEPSVLEDDSQRCPKCDNRLAEKNGSPISPYINTYTCTTCGWKGFRCGDSNCDGYLKPEESSYPNSVRYNCVKCGWTGMGPRV